MREHKRACLCASGCLCVPVRACVFVCDVDKCASACRNAHMHAQVERSQKGRTATLFVIFTICYMTAVVLQVINVDLQSEQGWLPGRICDAMTSN